MERKELILSHGLQDPRKLEDLTGLTELMNETSVCEAESLTEEGEADDDDDFVEL